VFDCLAWSLRELDPMANNVDLIVISPILGEKRVLSIMTAT
jgi:hypothetical protein